MYKIHKLDNGLTIVGEEIPHINSVTFGIWVNAGSRIEDPKVNGVSHFIEHMLFKGTKNRTAKEIARQIDALGGQINAFTSKECTCYYVKLLDEHIGIGVDILSDMILDPSFLDVDINKERSVILEELKMYEDSPDDLVYDMLMEKIYQGDGLGMNILGTRESINDLSKEDMLNYYSTYYVPNNSVISICGNFNFDDMVSMIEEKFSRWTAKEVTIDITEPVFKPCFITKNKDIEQVNLCINLKGVNLEDRDDIYALAVVNNIFGGSMSSRLFQSIREDAGMVYSIYSSPSIHRKSGDLGIFVSMGNENLETVYKLILEEIKCLKTNYLTQDEIDESREQLKGSYILGLESTSSRMMSMGKSQLLSEEIDTPKDILGYINKVDIEQVKSVIDKVFDLDNIAVSLVGKDVEGIVL